MKRKEIEKMLKFTEKSLPNTTVMVQVEVLRELLALALEVIGDGK